VAAKVKSGTRSRGRLWAEFLADHERVPRRTAGLKVCSKVRSGARFRYEMGPSGEAPRGRRRARHFEPQTSTVSILRYNS